MKKHLPPSFRPIPARMLKSIGDTLRPYLNGARVLDLYAGEGRFGLMALEQGAEHADFVENNPKLCHSLRASIAKSGASARVLSQDALGFLRQATNTTPYDIVFADPPFDSMTEQSVRELAGCVFPWLATEGIFLVKHPTRMLISGLLSIPGTGFRHWKDSAVGDAGLTYFLRE